MDGGAWWAAVHGVAKSRTRLSDFTFTFSLSCIGEGNGNPLQCSCLENPRGRKAWWAAVYGVTQSRIRLSSSSSIGIRMNCPKSSKESRKHPKYWLCNSLWQSCHSSDGIFFFSINCAGSVVYPCRKKYPDPYINTMDKEQLQMDYRSECQKLNY